MGGGEEYMPLFFMLDRGDCNFVPKIINAERAGASAVIIINNRPGKVHWMAFTDADRDRANSITIPSMMITQEDGNALKAAMCTGNASAPIKAGSLPSCATSDFPGNAKGWAKNVVTMLLTYELEPQGSTTTPAPGPPATP